MPAQHCKCEQATLTLTQTMVGDHQYSDSAILRWANVFFFSMLRKITGLMVRGITVLHLCCSVCLACLLLLCVQSSKAKIVHSSPPQETMLSNVHQCNGQLGGATDFKVPKCCESLVVPCLCGLGCCCCDERKVLTVSVYTVMLLLENPTAEDNPCLGCPRTRAVYVK